MLQVMDMYEVLLKLANRCDRWSQGRATTRSSHNVHGAEVAGCVSSFDFIKISVPIKRVTFDAAWLEGIGMTCLFV